MTLERATLRLYRALIRAFPEEFRLAHGTDLGDVTEDALRDSIRRRGRARLMLFVPNAQVQSTMLAEIPGGVRDPNALVRIQKPVAYPVYEELRDGTDRVVRLAGYVGPVPLTLASEDRSESVRVWGHLATPDYFDMLGIRAARGQLFRS